MILNSSINVQVVQPKSGNIQKNVSAFYVRQSVYALRRVVSDAKEQDTDILSVCRLLFRRYRSLRVFEKQPKKKVLR